MSDFDELSRSNWRQRKARRRRSTHYDDDTSGATIGLSEDEEVAPGPFINPGWRKERATGRNTRARRPRGGIYASPQEFQLWLQKGGWMFFAAGAVLIIGGLIFLLLQGRGATGSTTNPFEAMTAAPASNQGTASGDTAADSQGGIPAIPQQPTLTPEPASGQAEQGGGEFFVVSGTGVEGLLLRAAPVDGAMLATLPEGTRVETLGNEHIGPNYVWYKVRGPEGQEGWVAIDWLQPAP
jgi:hypothetical protein